MLVKPGAEGRKRPLYVRDEHAWMAQQIAVIRRGSADGLDTDHLLEFLTANVTKHHRELQRRMTLLLRCLLVVRLRSDRVLRFWIRSILEQQRQIQKMLRTLPSLHAVMPEILEDAYRDAVNEAAIDVAKPPHQLPSECPWTLQEALKFDVMPIIRRNRASAIVHTG